MSIRFAPHTHSCECGRCTRPPVDRMPEEQTSFRLPLPVKEHRAIIRTEKPVRGRLSLEPPRWDAGHTITVSTDVDPDNPGAEDPVRLDVVAVEAVEVGKLTAEHARRVGLSLASEAQRVALGLHPNLPAPFVHAKASGCKTVVWVTSWRLSQGDCIRLLAATVGYTSSSAMEVAGSAGEAPPAGWCPERTVGQYRTWLPERPGKPDGSLAAGDEVETHRQAAQAHTLAGYAQRRAVAKAKGQTAHRESTRRRRIETARTAGSVVAEPDELTILRLKAAELEAYPLRFVCGPDPHDEAA